MMHRLPGALERDAADIAALADHVAHPATTAYRALREPLWSTLHALGFDGGHILVQGDGARTLLALPDRPDIPIDFITAHLAPLQHIQAGQPQPPAIDGGPSDYDAVIASLPWADVQMRVPSRRARHTARQALMTIAATRLARPGGLVAVLAGHDLMDSPDPTPRHAVRAHAAFLGAVRLPAGALRPQAGTDNVVDLMLFTPTHDTGLGPSLRFAHSIPIPLDGHTVHINQYYDNNPDQILGNIDAEANVWDQHALTVTGNPTHLTADVSQALTTLATNALQHALVPTSDPDTPSETGEPGQSNGWGAWAITHARRYLPDLLRIDQRSNSTSFDPPHSNDGPTNRRLDL
ncbi:hypothetical protein [Isoptericola sp. NPDC019482]|uniref:hypothetical protein n=1 Tax=Isoptericola sp. NPDC019482 TaxID=3154688 RepID=UPI00347518AB